MPTDDATRPFPEDAEVAALKRAIDSNDLATVKALMTAHPVLHRAPVGYGMNGPLTWVAECRGLGAAPPVRLEMAQWMIDHGSDVHQGGDGPLMRAALNGQRVPMMELLVRNGADVNAEWNGDFPILFAPCESVNTAGLQWLLQHGANPNCPKAGRSTTALDYLIGTYARSSQMGTCIDLLSEAGGKTRYGLPGVLETVGDRRHRLAAQLDADPDLVHRRFPELDCGSTGARRLLLVGATLLHVAAEFSSMECAKLLIERGAQVNAPAEVNHAGVGGQTPIFHAVSQFNDYGFAMTELLLSSGADLSIRVKLTGHYDRPEEFVDCTPLEYAQLFPGSESSSLNERTVNLLRQKVGVH